KNTVIPPRTPSWAASGVGRRDAPRGLVVTFPPERRPVVFAACLFKPQRHPHDYADDSHDDGERDHQFAHQIAHIHVTAPRSVVAPPGTSPPWPPGTPPACRRGCARPDRRGGILGCSRRPDTARALAA